MTNSQDPSTSPLGTEVNGRIIEIPEPEWILHGNRVGCKYCGLKLKTTAKYKAHFLKRHLNEDGTWRIANKNFAPIKDPTPEELEALDIQEGLITKANRRVGKNEKPWWQL